MPINEYPIDDNALDEDEPLSSDVARDIVTDLVHVYRDRLMAPLCTAPALTAGGHTALYTTEVTYTDASIVVSFTWRISPWGNNFHICLNAINNGIAAARVRVGYIFAQGVRESVVIPAADPDWGAGQIEVTRELDLDKLKANAKAASPIVRIMIWCINSAEIYSVSITETHEP